MREKLSLPIGIREPSGSAKAPPAARSDNALWKERGGRRTRNRAGPPAGGVARRAGKINPRALCGGRGKSTHGHCAEKGSRAPRRAVFFVFHSLALRRRLSSPCVAAFHRPAPTPKGACADLPTGRAVAPVPCVAPSSPHADPAKEARADLPAGRAVVHASRGVPFIVPCRSRQRGSRRPSRGAGGCSRLSRRARAHKKNGAEAPFFCCLFTPWNR